MTQPYWGATDATAGAWDQVYVEGFLVPGICKIASPKLKRALEKKKPKGKDGARVKDNGYAGAEFTLQVQLVTADDWFKWQDFFPRLHPKEKGGKRKPVRVHHPVLTAHNLTRFYAEEFELPVPNDSGIGETTIKFTEVTKPKVIKRGSGRGSAKKRKDKTKFQDDDAFAGEALNNAGVASEEVRDDLGGSASQSEEPGLKGGTLKGLADSIENDLGL